MFCILRPLAVIACLLREPICLQLLEDSLTAPRVNTALGWHDDFRYWHGIVLLLCNPVVLMNYVQLYAFCAAMIYSSLLMTYLLVCYGIILWVSIEFAIVANEYLTWL